MCDLEHNGSHRLCEVRFLNLISTLLQATCNYLLMLFTSGFLMSWLLKFQSIGLLNVYQTVITKLEGREEFGGC